jgi:hypothetical protein
MLQSLFGRPKPQFRVGALVSFNVASEVQPRYMLIETRRWATLLGDTKKRWLYDGLLLRATDEKIEVRTTLVSVSEDGLAYFCGPRMN